MLFKHHKFKITAYSVAVLFKHHKWRCYGSKNNTCWNPAIYCSRATWVSKTLLLAAPETPGAHKGCSGASPEPLGARKSCSRATLKPLGTRKGFSGGTPEPLGARKDCSGANLEPLGTQKGSSRPSPEPLGARMGCSGMLSQCAKSLFKITGQSHSLCLTLLRCTSL